MGAPGREGLGSAGAKSCCGVGRRQAPAQHGTQSPGISRSGMDTLKDVYTCITESLHCIAETGTAVRINGPSVKIVKSKLLLQNGGQVKQNGPLMIHEASPRPFCSFTHAQTPPRQKFLNRLKVF